MLALLLERIAENACEDIWRNIRYHLRQIKLAQLSTPHGELWQVTEPSQAALNRLKQLGIPPPPLLLDVALQPTHTPPEAVPTTPEEDSRFPASVARACQSRVATRRASHSRPWARSSPPLTARPATLGINERKKRLLSRRDRPAEGARSTSRTSSSTRGTSISRNRATSSTAWSRRAAGAALPRPCCRPGGSTSCRPAIPTTTASSAYGSTRE